MPSGASAGGSFSQEKYRSDLDDHSSSCNCFVCQSQRLPNKTDHDAVAKQVKARFVQILFSLASYFVHR